MYIQVTRITEFAKKQPETVRLFDIILCVEIGHPYIRGSNIKTLNPANAGTILQYRFHSQGRVFEIYILVLQQQYNNNRYLCGICDIRTGNSISRCFSEVSLSFCFYPNHRVELVCTVNTG